MKLKLLLIPALLLLTALDGLTQQTARVVQYHANDIIAVKARMRYTTMIQLPPAEKIMQVATGDKDFWIIDAVGNYCFLHPAKEGIHSNLNLITDKSNVYSFTLDDDETTAPDLKVIVEPSDPATIAAVSSIPRFVPASEVAAAQQLAQAAQTHAREQVEQFRSQYPTKVLKFDYLYRGQKPFDIAAIYHDAQFTYIRSSASEKFTVYELKDGKPSLINFELEDGTYVLPKVVDQAYLQIGKHKLVFERKAH
jgi:type IV secretion system protein VirB9